MARMSSDGSGALPGVPAQSSGDVPANSTNSVPDHATTLMDAMRAVLALLDDLEVLRVENRQLKEALEGRALIERAKGMLMASRDCDEAAAFQVLVGLSRKQRRKVRAVAADVAAGPGADGPAASPPT
jgi:hypothetical protein